MGFLGTLKGLPVLLLVAVILLFVANLFNLIAFSTTAWGESYFYILGTVVLNPTSTYTNFGLWRVCTGSQANYILGQPGSCSEIFTGTGSAWLAAVQALTCIALIGLVLSLVLVVAYLLGKSDSDYLLVAAILCIATGILYLIGCIVFGVKFNSVVVGTLAVRKLGWSFGLAVVACLLEIVSGVLLLVGRKGASTSPA